MVPQRREGVFKLLFHSLRASPQSLGTFASIESHVLKRTITDYFPVAERRGACVLYRRLIMRSQIEMCASQPHPIALLSNAFEVNHNEALYLNCLAQRGISKKLKWTSPETRQQHQTAFSDHSDICRLIFHQLPHFSRINVSSPWAPIVILLPASEY